MLTFMMYYLNIDISINCNYLNFFNSLEKLWNFAFKMSSINIYEWLNKQKCFVYASHPVH